MAHANFSRPGETVPQYLDSYFSGQDHPGISRYLLYRTGRVKKPNFQGEGR